MNGKHGANEFFYCYSPQLNSFLRRKGQRYICAGLNEKTMRKFWQYRRTTELNTLLDEWKAGKPKGASQDKPVK